MEAKKPWEYIFRKRHWIFACLTYFCQGVFCDRSHIQHYTSHIRKNEMKTKSVSFSLVAIKFPFGLQNYWKKKFLIPLIGLNWSVCFNNFFCWVTVGKYYFSKAESANINSVQSRTQRLRSRPSIQTMIPGFLKLMIFRIGTFEYSPFGCGQSTRRCLLSPSVLCFS